MLRASTDLALVALFPLYRAVVLIFVDLVGKLVLLFLQSGLVRSGQVAIVQLAHIALFLVQFRFLFLQVAGFAGRQLATRDALRNSILLILVALSHRHLLTAARRGDAARRGRAGWGRRRCW